jgi:hypothetical protein
MSRTQRSSLDKDARMSTPDTSVTTTPLTELDALEMAQHLLLAASTEGDATVIDPEDWRWVYAHRVTDVS